MITFGSFLAFSMPPSTNRASSHIHAPRDSDFIDAAAARRRLKHNFTEIVMFIVMYFALLLEHIGLSFERAERHRRDEYLASARDLVDLELRMRLLERDGYPR
ncbi:DUF3563 family protein [Paraburkholderia sp. RL17-373-BIF-A]|uniref:DUF3563 family protein n=1 Tax=Paraburkholderia sp. RL17-373-BIF-A TaxID=3031629 RepID=UPI0038B7A4FB